jgi:hypothetical protein
MINGFAVTGALCEIEALAAVPAREMRAEPFDKLRRAQGTG